MIHYKVILKKKMKKEDKNRILSKVFNQGQTILETIYNPQDEETYLAVHEDGGSTVREEYTDSRGDILHPTSPSTDFVKSGLVRLPSRLEAYEGPEKMYEKVKSFLNEFVQMDSEFVSVSAVYVLMTWVYDKFRTIPYLRVIGTYGTGKSRFLEVMASMSYKGMLCGGSTTTSAMFRMVDMIQGTLVFDEADFQSSETWSDIVKVLNSGHSRGGTVSRTERVGKDGEFAPRTFSVYTPKILGSRKRFSDEALESRCLTRHLYPLSAVQRPVHLPADFEKRATGIRNQLMSFRFDSYLKIQEEQDALQEISSPRLKQMALALATTAKMISPKVYQQILDYLRNYERDLQAWQEPNLEADILYCLGMLRNTPEAKDSKKIHMEEIGQYFNKNLAEGKTSYGGFSYKDEITSKKVGSVIKALHLRKGRDGKGYFIPLDTQQMKAIDSLLERHGIEKLINQSSPESITDQTEEDDIWPKEQ